MTKIQIGAVRFYNKTWIENVQWKQKNKYIGCIYGMDKEIPARVPYGSKIYVIEMNNSINKIMGIGVYIIFIGRKTEEKYMRMTIIIDMYKGHKRKSRRELLEINEILFYFWKTCCLKVRVILSGGMGCQLYQLKDLV